MGVRVRGPGTETPTSLILRGGEEAQASVVGCGRPLSVDRLEVRARRLYEEARASVSKKDAR